jgi:myosin phosphatase Rho-interacting protein
MLLQPETVPQCIIDMNSVLEVTPAEDITGHPHSIALTMPDGVHFVKGMSSEESRWWCEVLSVFVRSKVNFYNSIFIILW